MHYETFFSYIIPSQAFVFFAFSMEASLVYFLASESIPMIKFQTRFLEWKLNLFTSIVSCESDLILYSSVSLFYNNESVK